MRASRFMNQAAKPRYVVVLLMMLTLGASLGLPAEDVLDAVYNESETLPFETAPQFAGAKEQLCAGEPQALTKRDSVPVHRCITPCRERPCQQSNSVHPANDSLVILDHSLRC